MPQNYIIMPEGLIICAWLWNAWISNNMRLKLHKSNINKLFATFSHVCLTKLYILPFYVPNKIIYLYFSNTICRKSKWLNEKLDYELRNIGMVHCVFFPVGYFQMSSQIACLRRGIITLVTFVWLFSNVYFQMCPQSACLRGWIVTLVAFVWLFSTVCFQMCP